MRTPSVYKINRVPVVFAQGVLFDSIGFLPLAELAPVYPLTSVFVSLPAHDLLGRVAKTILASEPDWAEIWSRTDVLFHNVYLHILANTVSHHVSGRWLAADSDWIAARGHSSKGREEAEASCAARVPHVAEVTLLRRARFHFHSTIDGRLEIGVQPQQPACWANGRNPGL